MNSGAADLDFYKKPFIIQAIKCSEYPSIRYAYIALPLHYITQCERLASVNFVVLIVHGNTADGVPLQDYTK